MRTATVAHHYEHHHRSFASRAKWTTRERNGQGGPGGPADLGLWAPPNGTVSGDTGIYTFPSKAVVPENFFTTRVDHTISSSDSLHGTYLLDKGSTTQPDSLNVVSNVNETTRQVGAIEETHVFGPRLVNSARVGVNRVVAATLHTAPGANPLGADQGLGIAPGLYAPVIQVTGLTNFAGGLNGTSFGNYWFTAWQFYDDAFWSLGKHSLKMGFSFERIDSNLLLAANPDGVFRFNTLSDFLINKPASLQFQYGTLTQAWRVWREPLQRPSRLSWWLSIKNRAARARL